MPGIIQSFDPDAIYGGWRGLLSRSVETDNGGNRVTKPYPAAGGCAREYFLAAAAAPLTFPVKPVMNAVIFRSLHRFFWWQRRRGREPVDDQVHDLSDAFCIVGPQSQAQNKRNKYRGRARLRSDDGSTFFESSTLPTQKEN
ncbi:hypothetical protein KCP75_13575 [Salmonella enterica subsp. enterica]|nr:hypothetical protein KCP75_13575 [Salmonella enterica subsp. enterica]